MLISNLEEKKMSNFISHIEIYDEPRNSYIEHKCLVEFDYTPFSRGDRGSYGEPLSPDSEAEIEIVEINCNGIRMHKLEENQEIIEQLEQEAWDYLASFVEEY